MIYNRRNKHNDGPQYRPVKNNTTSTDITAMLDLLAIDSKYFSELLGIDAYSFSSLTDDLPICLWAHDEYHTIVYGNIHFMENYGSCAKRSCYKCIMGEKRPCRCCLAERAFASNKPQSCKFCKKTDSGYELNSFHIPVRNKHGDKFILKSSFHVDPVKTLYDLYFNRKENEWTSLDDYIPNYSSEPDERLRRGLFF